MVVGYLRAFMGKCGSLRVVLDGHYLKRTGLVIAKLGENNDTDKLPMFELRK